MAGPLKVIDLTFVLGVLLKAAITLPIVGFTATVRQRLLQFILFLVANNYNKVPIKRAL